MNKTTIKTFFQKNWRLKYISYAFIYLPWFFLMEHIVTADYARLHIINTPLDDLIPFCEYFIIPYYMWFFYIVGSCIFMYFRSTDEEFRHFAWSIIIGMSASLVICFLYPSGLTLRPAAMPRDNIFTRLLGAIWLADTPTNVFPSIHVYVSLAIHVGLNKCLALQKHRMIRLLSLIVCTLICISTVFIKQHSFMDVLGAGVLMLVLYPCIYSSKAIRNFIFKRA